MTSINQTKPTIKEQFAEKLKWVYYKGKDGEGLSDFELDQATTQLLELIDKEVIGGNLLDDTAERLRAGTFRRGDDRYVCGYNQAKAEQRKLLKGQTNE